MNIHILIVIFLLLGSFSLKVTSYIRPDFHLLPHNSFDISIPARFTQPSYGSSRNFDYSMNPFFTPFHTLLPDFDDYIKPETPSLEELHRESFLKWMNTRTKEPESRINTRREQPQFNPSSMSCGVRGQNVHLMAGGTVTKRDEWPWLVALFWKISSSVNNNKQFKCGASLISKKHVITAAHCVHNDRRAISKEQILLSIGAYDINKDNEDFATSKTPTSIVLAPNYAPGEYDNDLAILTISDVYFSRYIKPACLWKSYDRQELYQNFNSGTVIGWGRDEHGNNYTPHPKSIKVPIVPLSTCRSSHLTLYDTATSNKFCAGNKDKTGPCNGDSGGGFYLEIDNKWYLRGIVSSGVAESSGRYCNLNEYVVYIDLAKYSSWINSQL